MENIKIFFLKLMYFISGVFCLDFFKFSGPLCLAWAYWLILQKISELENILQYTRQLVEVHFFREMKKKTVGNKQMGYTYCKLSNNLRHIMHLKWYVIDRWRMLRYNLFSELVFCDIFHMVAYQNIMKYLKM